MTTRRETTTVLRLGGRAAYANGMVAAVGLLFLVAMFVSFAVGATSIGLVFGWINDVSGVVAALLMLPLVVAVHVLLRPHAPILSRLATVIRLGANLAIMVLQSLLVLGALAFQEEVGPVLIAFLFLVVWLVLTGYLGSSSGALPHGLRNGSPRCDVCRLPDLGIMAGPTPSPRDSGAGREPGRWSRATSRDRPMTDGLTVAAVSH